MWVRYLAGKWNRSQKGQRLRCPRFFTNLVSSSRIKRRDKAHPTVLESLRKQLRSLASTSLKQRLNSRWINRARRVLDLVWLEEYLLSEAEMYNHLFDLCRTVGNKELAISLLYDMHDQGMQISRASLHDIIALCAGAKDWDRVLAFFEQSGMDDKFAMNYGLRAISAVNGPEAALAHVDKMVESGNFKPSTKTFTSILAEVRSMEDAWSIISRMREAKLKISLNVYGALLRVCRRLEVRPEEKLSKGRSIWRKMEESKKKGNERCYTELMLILKENEEWQEIAELFVEALRLEVKIQSQQLYELAIEAHAERLEFKKSMVLLQEAKSREVPLSKGMFLAALKSCEKACSPDMTVFLFDQMIKTGVELDGEIYSIVFSSLFQAENYAKVLELFEQSQDRITMSSLNSETRRCIVAASDALGLQSQIFEDLRMLE